MSEVKGIKGFNKDLTCRGFQFEEGGSYEITGHVMACQSGFHACPDEHHPLSVFEFYPPTTSIYREVLQSGDLSAEGVKLASTKITIGVEISLGELTTRAIDYVVSRCKPSGAASNSGDYGAASNSGDYGAASNSGYQGAASNSGDYGAASNSGTRGAASNSGTRGAASNSGDYGAAFSHANLGQVMCEGNNQALFCSEFNDEGELVSVASGITGHNNVQANVWYTCKNWELVPA